MVERAEVVRIESQLTVPSRHHSHLRDYWISIAWKSGNERWISTFGDVATPLGATPTAFGVLSVVPLSPNKGWIVARGVDGKLVRPEDLETKVRDLTAEVNARVAEAPLLGQRSSIAETWPEKVRSRLARANAAVLPFGPSARRGDADAAPSA